MQLKPKHVIMTSAFASALFMLPMTGKAAEWKIGMSHPQVKELQQLLKAKGFFTYPTATGYFGTITEKAVKDFQASVHLPATGIVDDQTYEKLKSSVTSANQSKSKASRPLQIGSTGDAVKVLQQNLKKLGYFTYPQITGYYGTITADAVKKFQKASRLAITGVADSQTVQAIQNALNRQTASPSNETALRIGSKGPEVSKLQQNLKQLGYFTYPQITDYYGTITSDAVRKFQQQSGLKATGVADSTTLAKIREAVDQKTKPSSSTPKTTIYLTIGSTGQQVEQVQAKLKQLGHFTYPTITGYFGQVTAEAVKKFQQSAKLKVTGVVDNETYEQLMGQAPAVKLDVMELMADAAELLGKPYVWGGQTPEVGFDCSGFIVYLFKKQGLSLPRTVAMMWNTGTSIATPSVGDIVFFQTDGPGASHAGIYIGNNQFIHSGSSTGVTISQLNNSYWKARYLGAKRYY
ncbi:C40 family peptidase [Thermaerobacillus caldiproteolyticus]|uniref:C40 family peptidase n=1 Tax=Thermaerobacillus caldiproteolyticus TaxID=247480 RepID=UPI00188D3139|nr:peptidoglycan-binding protein [Anoxybacillus caldiproteolyticus]QPA30773.1 peptidoglycan-binding protein [Anoxybacillus caldiproteolyticus]